ncbi:Pre-mRNA-splicing factor 18 [Characodon lateralis]|uniref:Pre-mRNA-splicing factor 18 n=1 Tax=Characodon lateralis TaxID=208331 RepID=A0ABU7D7L7_9TELE|nr:Pre-mRNA-splicing factor 18 [Characodon lateralis]
MDILKAEIARKRKLLEEKQLVDETKKCFKRADLARKEKEEYFKRCGYKVQTGTPKSQVFCEIYPVFSSFHQPSQTSYPGPAEEKHPHSMMLPPPCFPKGMVCSG